MEQIAIYMFICVFILLISGYPVALTLGGVATLFGVLFLGLDFFLLLPSRFMGVISNYVLLAVPLFVMMGVTLERSGIASRLLKQMSRLFGSMPGGLAISTIVVGTILAASTGIVGATVVTMGLISLPVMMDQGYRHEVSTGVILASGTLGQIIPPSIVLVLLGSVMNVSVGDLFKAALIPSALLVCGYVLYVLVLGRLRPEAMSGASSLHEKVKWSELLSSLLAPMLLILLVLGAIFLGIASPTESAALGAAGALILTFTKGQMTKSLLHEIMRETAHITTMIFFILFGATTLALVFRGMGGDTFLLDLVTTYIHSGQIFLFIVMITLFVLGFFIDFIELVFIVVPVVTPIFISYDIDLVWLAILFAINLQTSFLTPPFGFAIFYLRGVAPPSVKTTAIYKGVWPFLVIQLIVLVFVYLFPNLLIHSS